MSVDAQEPGVTKTGAHFVQTKEELKKIRFLVPGSSEQVSVPKPRTPRRPPKRIQFGMVHDRRLRMVRPIPVEIDRKGDTVVARWDEIQEFGYGNNISEALDDFGKTIEELYFTLSERRDILSPDLEEVWGRLSRHISLRDRG